MINNFSTLYEYWNAQRTHYMNQQSHNFPHDVLTEATGTGWSITARWKLSIWRWTYDDMHSIFVIWFYLLHCFLIKSSLSVFLLYSLIYYMCAALYDNGYAPVPYSVWYPFVCYIPHTQILLYRYCMLTCILQAVGVMWWLLALSQIYCAKKVFILHTHANIFQLLSVTWELLSQMGCSLANMHTFVCNILRKKVDTLYTAHACII